MVAMTFRAKFGAPSFTMRKQLNLGTIRRRRRRHLMLVVCSQKMTTTTTTTM